MSLATLCAQNIHWEERRMPEKVKRLRPARLDTITESIQVILDAPLDLTWEARSCLNEVLGKVAPPETWGFVMLNPEQQRLVLRAINQGEKPNVTLRVWIAAISHIRYDTGEIMARRKRLAEDADTTPEETSRALTQLTEIGALLKLKHGHYAINPHVGWQGSLRKREQSAKAAPALVISR
jgi:hypothetical protein